VARSATVAIALEVPDKSVAAGVPRGSNPARACSTNTWAATARRLWTAGQTAGQRNSFARRGTNLRACGPPVASITMSSPC